MGLMSFLFSFEGRVRRRDWWLFEISTIGFIWFIVMLVTIWDSFPYELMKLPHPFDKIVDVVLIAAVVVIFILISWASLAITVKRWHDRDKSGWWILISLIPFIGGIWALIENGFLDGDYGANEYGQSPKLKKR